LEDFVPFTHNDLVAFGEEGAQEMEAVEVTLMAWICARCLKCIVPAKVIPMLETSGELFTVATFDDIAFLLLLFEDSFKVWMEMAAAKKKLVGEPASKRVCRHDYKTQKTYQLGNGLSGKEAQKRYVVIRNRVAKYLKTPTKKSCWRNVTWRKFRSIGTGKKQMICKARVESSVQCLVCG
jgi:hypothetical protein